MLVGRVVDVAFAHSLFDDSDEMVSVVEKVTPFRTLRVPRDCSFAGYAFNAIDRDIRGINTPEMLGSAVLGAMLVKLGLPPDALGVSDVDDPLLVL